MHRPRDARWNRRFFDRSGGSNAFRIAADGSGRAVARWRSRHVACHGGFGLRGGDAGSAARASAASGFGKGARRCGSGRAGAGCCIAGGGAAGFSGGGATTIVRVMNLFSSGGGSPPGVSGVSGATVSTAT
ncbi:MAG: hypothetical protein WKG52_06130 [Variovorax sp.]